MMKKEEKAVCAYNLDIKVKEWLKKQAHKRQINTSQFVNGLLLEAMERK